MFLQFLQFLHLLGVRHVEVCREILIASQRQEKDDEEVVKTNSDYHQRCGFLITARLEGCALDVSASLAGATGSSSRTRGAPHSRDAGSTVRGCGTSASGTRGSLLPLDSKTRTSLEPSRGEPVVPRI
jgi:hypothetical protein